MTTPTHHGGGDPPDRPGLTGGRGRHARDTAPEPADPATGEPVDRQGSTSPPGSEPGPGSRHRPRTSWWDPEPRGHVSVSARWPPLEARRSGGAPRPTGVGRRGGAARSAPTTRPDLVVPHSLGPASTLGGVGNAADPTTGSWFWEADQWPDDEDDRQDRTSATTSHGGGSTHRAAPAGAVGGGRRRRRRSAGPSLTASTGSMAIGTLISRVTGFLRTFVLIFALGGATNLANAYNNGNTIPNAIYDLVLGGILTSVLVPLLVRAAKRDPDRGEAYNQRMFTLSVLVLGAFTVVATLASSLLVDLYAYSVHGTERHLIVVFGYFFIPQIFFYGMTSLVGAILNARNSFAAPMWTPILNNVVIIIVGLLFVVMFGFHATPGTISGTGVTVLGIGTTAGLVVQSAALVPALRRVGFRWRPRFDFRRSELTEIGRMAGWMVGYVVTTQVTFLVTQNVANAASTHTPVGGVSAYQYSYSLFLLPYAIIGVSVITALLPRMSRHAAAHKYWLLREDFSHSIRLSSALLVPAALVLAVLATPLCELIFSYGHSSVAQATYIGEAFAIFSLGLLPFVVFQLMLRVFYAMNNSRTPAIVGFWTMLATVAGNLLVLAVLPAGQVVLGMAAVYGITSVLAAALAGKLLLRKVGSLDGRAIVRSLTRMHIATLPALAFAAAVTLAAGVVLRPGPVYGLVTVALGGGGAVLLYLRFSKTLGVQELPELIRTVAQRFGTG